MVTAFIFPLLDVFLTILWVFLFVLWIWLVIAVVADIFASRDLRGPTKALWFLLILFFPLVGVVVYMLARGGHMAERRAERVGMREQVYQDWAARAGRAGPLSVAEELERLTALRERGIITDAEFGRQKERLLA